MNLVLDACALIAYLRGEPGSEIVDALLSDPSVSCFAHSINLCEVHYHFLRAADEATATQVLLDLDSVGLIERSDIGRPFWRRVGALKPRGRISLADCFCLALSQELGATLVTSDHHEYDAIVPLGICPIRFIR